MRLLLVTGVPFPLVTTPFELLHVTTGVNEVFPTILPLQVSVYICPATGLPEVVMLMVCTETEIEKDMKRMTSLFAHYSTQNR